MVNIKVGKNDKNQRLDRFLRKYYKKATLSHIYKLIRKDVKVNGKRGKNDTILLEEDVITIYIPEEASNALRGDSKPKRAKRQFAIVYEDEDVLIVNKPFGLLTHGDKSEKKNTLVNQVVDYLIEKEEYIPRLEQTFKPACVNRLDRNTTGLVIFGKTAEAVREYAALMRDKSAIEKYYMTITAGCLERKLELRDSLVKDGPTNTTRISDEEGSKAIETIATPISHGAVGRREFTLVEVRLITGRTHQIRLHLSHAGYPLVGDPKYGQKNVNDFLRKNYGVSTQLLHCGKLVFNKGSLQGKVISCDVPPGFSKIQRELNL